ncbi:4a-hydroxytetrahydrobiopterin dehydratase [Candidatus Marinamargulisbacteria bacterium SCGC AG-439-L15]|nr:4a-hydroxytetrahydrobiopterin dehydratase [Candidatus Marinamargulisbacteria bacterium SCGC AG-439-L15]
MSELASRECIPCRGGVPPLKGDAVTHLYEKLGSDWAVVEDHHLEKEYSFPDFKEAMTFLTKVGNLAEEIGHHPDLFLTWGMVKVTIWTHKIDGLAEADFIFAAKCETLL